MIFDAKGLPSGIVRKQVATQIILEKIKTRLFEASKQIEPLGGINYAANQIFRLGSYNTVEEMCELINAIIMNSQKLLNVIKYSPAGIYVADNKGIIIFVNKAFTNYHELDTSYFINNRVEELEHQGIFRPIITPMIIRTGRKTTILQHVRNNTGDSTSWIVTGVPIFNENRILEMIVTNSHNIEEYDQLKRYAEKSSECHPPQDDEIVYFGGEM